MIDLTCCTLVSLIYDKSQEHLDRTIRVINYMQGIAQFGHAMLFSAAEVKDAVLAEVVQIPPTDIAGLQQFQISILPRLILTPFMMVVHDDSGIIEPDLWKSEFLQYDFVGAPWGDGIVGNEGFSLQSQKMLWAKTKLPYVETNQGDEFVCRTHRQHMLDLGVVFAPCDLALQFSTETFGNEYPSFGYHGKTASQSKYQKCWELIAASEATYQPSPITA